MTEDHDEAMLPEFLERLKSGSESASREVFDRYCERLMLLARRRIGARMSGRMDPEDVIQSAFRTFFVHVQNDEFQFEKSGDLFKLLVRITVHKALRQIAYHRAAKRNPAMETGHSDSAYEQLQQVAGRERTAEAEVMLIEEFNGFLSKLEPLERQVLEMRLAGHGTAEIAVAVGSYERKIRRILERIRETAERSDGLDADSDS